MANQNDSRILKLFKGSFEHIPVQNSSLIRLFLSSTTSGEFLNILSILNLFSSFLFGLTVIRIIIFQN